MLKKPFVTKNKKITLFSIKKVTPSGVLKLAPSADLFALKPKRRRRAMAILRKKFEPQKPMTPKRPKKAA